MLEIEDLEVTYKNVILGVKKVSLNVPKNKITAFLGANGAGKTTTIRAVTGLLKFHSGNITKGAIHFDGKEITSWNSRSIGMAGIMQVPEGRRVFSQLTTEENLLVGSSANSLNNQGRIKLAEKIYEYFPRLYERRNLNAGYLSGGEQQMLAIGRALMAQPKLLVIDELSLGLAPLIVWDITKKLTEINRQENLTILLVEQNARLALAVSEYSYVLENGLVALEGPSHSLQDNSVFKAAYLG
ncbi:MAG: ABC transporter ATP-binding protein [Deltaproteobacteria bacterium]|nr:ABC transporter ATP-binding protein [Deltaproteobacteria bacterium]